MVFKSCCLITSSEIVQGQNCPPNRSTRRDKLVRMGTMAAEDHWLPGFKQCCQWKNKTHMSKWRTLNPWWNRVVLSKVFCMIPYLISNLQRKRKPGLSQGHLEVETENKTKMASIKTYRKSYHSPKRQTTTRQLMTRMEEAVQLLLRFKRPWPKKRPRQARREMMTSFLELCPELTLTYHQVHR